MQTLSFNVGDSKRVTIDTETHPRVTGTVVVIKGKATGWTEYGALAIAGIRLHEILTSLAPDAPREYPGPCGLCGFKHSVKNMTACPDER